MVRTKNDQKDKKEVKRDKIEWPKDEEAFKIGLDKDEA